MKICSSLHSKIENEITQVIGCCVCVCMCVYSCSVMSDSLQPLWTIARQAPLSMRFPRQEYWSGLPFPTPEDFPEPGIEPESLELAGKFFTTEPPGKHIIS